jgi:hypothetical protein
MKTKVLLALVLLSSMVGAGRFCLAQSFEVIAKRTTVNGTWDDVNESGYFDDTQVKIRRAATNGASNIRVVEVERNMAPDHYYMYCWNSVCVPTPANLLNLNGSDDFARSGLDSLKLQYYPNDKPGQSTIKFRISNIDNDNEAQDVTFSFNVTPVGIFRTVSFSNPDALSAPRPCPAPAEARLSYHVPAGTRTAYVKLFDLMGRELGRFDLEQPTGELVINVRNLQEGIYFYALVANNQTVATKRLVVSR